MCAAVTAKFNGALVRYYTGHSSVAGAVNHYATAPVKDITDALFCTADRCNDPTKDQCASAAGRLPAVTSMLCGGAPTGPAPAPAAAPIVCWSNANSTSAALQARPAAGLCIALTHVCQAPPDPFSNCAGKAVGTAVRVYTDVTALSGTLGSNAAVAQSLVDNAQLGYLTTSSLLVRNTLFDAITICNTAGCNDPTKDACALADKAAVAAVVFNSLPPTAVGADGKLTAAAAAVLTNSIQYAVTATVCATCKVALQRAVDASGRVLRQLQATAGAVTVTFSIAGGSTATLAAVAAAVSTPSFTAAATSAVAANPGYSTVTVASAPSASAAPPTSSAEDQTRMVRCRPPPTNPRPL